MREEIKLLSVGRMKMSVLEIRNIQKKFGNLEVLKDISLSVDKGDVLSIIWDHQVQENQHF